MPVYQHMLCWHVLRCHIVGFGVGKEEGRRTRWRCRRRGGGEGDGGGEKRCINLTMMCGRPTLRWAVPKKSHICER